MIKAPPKSTTKSTTGIAWDDSYATNKSAGNIRNMSTSNNSNPYRHDPGEKLNQNMAYWGLDDQNNKVKKYTTPQKMAYGNTTKNYYVDDQGYYGGSVAGTPYYDNRKLKGSWSDTPDEFGNTKMESSQHGPGKYVVKDRNGNFQVYEKTLSGGRNGAIARGWRNYALPEGIDPYTMNPVEQKPFNAGYDGNLFNKYFGDYMRSLGGQS